MPEPIPLEGGSGRPRFNLATLPEIEEITAPSRPSVTSEGIHPAPVSEAPPAAGVALTPTAGLAQIVCELRVDPSTTVPQSRNLSGPKLAAEDPAPARADAPDAPDVCAAASPPIDDPVTPIDRHGPADQPPVEQIPTSALSSDSSPSPIVARAVEGARGCASPAPSRLVRLVQSLSAAAPTPVLPSPGAPSS